MLKLEVQESNRIEFKRELNDKLEKEVVGFLNYHEGGHIYIGIDDDGTILGLEDLDGLQLKIKDRIKHNILPSTLGLFDVICEKTENKGYIKITVASGSEKPYYIKNYGMSPKGCYMRIGSSTEPMTQNMIEDLFARRTRNSIGRIEAPKANLSFEQLKIFYEECGLKLNEQFLSNLELVTNTGKQNYVAYLLSDANGTSIKVAKYSGKDRYDLIENNEYGYCSLIKATNRVLDKFKIENRTMTKITPGQRIEENLVDAIALREVVINAIVHNDYTNEIPPKFEIFADRIEITSAGGLVNGMSEEDFFNGYSAPRNKEIMRVFKDIKLVEHLGSGMARILKKYKKSNFTITSNFLRVTLPFVVSNLLKHNGGLNEGLNEGLTTLLDIIIKNPGIKVKDIPEKLEGRPYKTIERQMKELRCRNLIERRGSKKIGGYYIVE